MKSDFTKHHKSEGLRDGVTKGLYNRNLLIHLERTYPISLNLAEDTHAYS